MHIDTIAVHAGQKPEPNTGAITTPVFQTSTYVQPALGEHKGYEYSRTHNPTRDALQTNLATLENARYGIAFSSGCAAATTLMHTFKSGDHIICADDVYGGTYRLFDKVFTGLGLEFSFVDLNDPECLKEYIKPKTRGIWIETPTNPMLKIVDLKKISHIAHQHNLMVICDNTFMTPIFQRPLELGCDVVVHSTSKFINGHCDVIGGFIATNDKKIAEKLYFLQNSIGAVPGPWDSFLVLRGAKTLSIRMRVHDKNGRSIANYLEDHEDVKQVIYPGLKSHPQYELAKRQMTGFGSMISFVLKGDLNRVKKFFSHLKIFVLAESLGGIESLAEHPAIMTHASVEPEIRVRLGISDTLIRLSVGIESAEDLISDLKQAFKNSK